MTCYGAGEGEADCPMASRRAGGLFVDALDAALAGLARSASWVLISCRFSLVPREGQLIEVRRSFLEAIGLWDACPEGSESLPTEDSLVLKNSSLRLDGLDFDSRVLDLDHGEISNWKYALWTGQCLCLIRGSKEQVSTALGGQAYAPGVRVPLGATWQAGPGAHRAA